MKRKELKNLAKKIAASEYIVQTSKNPEEIKRHQEIIVKLSGHISGFEDMVLLDEYIQDFLKSLT